MKITSWTLLAKNLRPNIFQFLFATPLLSARIYIRNRSRKEPFKIILLKFLLSLFFLTCVIFIAKNFLQPLNYTKMIVISPMIYLFTEVIGGLGQLLFYLSHLGITQIHRHPLRSKSIGEFWGRRWNFWVRDWLVGQGLACRLAGSDRVSRYAAANREHGAHAHFQCNGCGKTICLEEVSTPRLTLRVPRGYRTDAAEVIVRGACAECN